MVKTKWSIFTSKTTVLDVSIKKCSLLQGTTDLYTVFIRISTLGASLISETFSVGAYSSWALIQIKTVYFQFSLHAHPILFITRNDHRPNWAPLSAITYAKGDSTFSFISQHKTCVGLTNL